MIVILGIWIGIVALGILSAKEQGSILNRISLYLYKKLSGLKMGAGGERNVLKNLMQLHPERSAAQVLADYYVGKIRIFLMVTAAGSILACCLRLTVESSESFSKEGKIRRTLEEQELTLKAEIDVDGNVISEEVTVTVEPKIWKAEEAEKLYGELLNELKNSISGENKSLQEVRQDLVLPDEVEGYPFVIEWRSSSPLIDEEGTVNNIDLDTAETVTLTVKVFYEELEWRHEFDVVVYPPVRTEKEQMLHDLQNLINSAHEEARYEEEFALPQAVDGKNILWSAEKEDNSMLILALTLGTAAAMYVMKDRDLQKEVFKRRNSMREAYPVIVSKFALFLGAGMTVRSTFVKICRDHDTGNGGRGEREPIYREMQISCNELQTGISESKVLEQFGRRTGVAEYTKLCTLLSQNIKRGNAALVHRLQEECERALVENRNLQKKKGEEAETKLLVPMVMMLIMVMIMIMLPAFSGIGIS